MREVLNYPQIDAQKLELAKKLIEEIAANPADDGSYELRELNRITGKQYSARHFYEYWGWTDLDTLAENALIPEPPCVRDLSREEMKEIVSIIKKALLAPDDNNAKYYMELLHKSLPLSDVVGYIRLEQDEETIVANMLRASSDLVIAL